MMERGTIEVAPLAYMRGRSQPYDRQVLTPDGFRSIGSLRVGDLVVGSNGLPRRSLACTPGPQGGLPGPDPGWRLHPVLRRAPVGGTTAADRRRGRPCRVLETRQMRGRLRAAHAHRFELPLVSQPVELQPQTVPMDPYALGLLLGDGCLTTSTTPSFTTADPELAVALEAALDGIELRRKTSVDYVLRHAAGHRGGVIVSNPVTAVLRELGLAGTRSNTKFVPTLPPQLLPCPPGCAPGAAGQRRGTGHPGGADLPHPVRDILAAPPGRRGVPGAVTRRRRLLADPPRRRAARPDAPGAAMSTTGRTPTSWTSGCPRASSRSG